MTQSCPAALSDFPPPPAHFRLFEPTDSTGTAPGVVILPPNIPPPSTMPYVFGQPHSLDPPPLPIDQDEMLFDPDENLRTSLLQLHRELQVGSVALLRCLVSTPSEHEKHARHVGRLMRNLQALLRNVRSREARMLVLQRLRDQVARKQAYVQTASRALPAIEARVEGQLRKPVERSTDHPSVEELRAWAALLAPPAKSDDEMSLDSDGPHPQPPDGISNAVAAKDSGVSNTATEPALDLALPEGGIDEAAQSTAQKRGNEEPTLAPYEKGAKLARIHE